MRADGWSRMPLVRMTNLHLEPGEGSLEELIADVDDGIYLETNRSWSIDDKRLNFQFGTQIAWEIKNGKLGRMLRDATYTGVTPGLLGLARRGRRARGVGAARADELRQGPAGPARARLARRLARALPQRPGRRQVVSERSSSPSARCAVAAGDEAEVVVSTRALGLRPLRRLRGAPADADRERRSSQLRVVRDGRRRASRPTNRTDDEGLRELAAPRGRGRGQRAATTPTSPALAPPADPPAVEGYDEETAALGAEDQARLAAAAIDASGDLDLYGFFTSGVSELAIASTTGLRASQRMTDATVPRAGRGRRRVRLRGADRAGARATIDPAAVGRGGGREGGADARRASSSSPAATARCSSRTRSPSCSHYFSFDAFNGLGLLEERSYFAGRIGEQVFDRGSRSPTTRSTRAGCRRRSTSRARRSSASTLVENGVDRAASSGTGRRPRGAGRESHRPRAARRARARWGPLAVRALAWRRGEAESVDELAELVGDGIYVTRLHYLSVVDPREGVITGMTRDGTFRIRDGKVAEPLVNLRFTVSVPDLLADVPGLTRETAARQPERLLRRALRVRAARARPSRPRASTSPASARPRSLTAA